MEEIKKVLYEWLSFSWDVKPECAAGEDHLNHLRAATSELLKEIQKEEQQ